MAQQLPTRVFCGKLFFISECLYRESHVPSSAAPPLSNEELNECDDIVIDAMENLMTKDLLSMLISTFHIALPIDFVRRLAAINKDVHAADQAKRADPAHVMRYWLRIANTYSMLFVLQVVQERCKRKELQDEFDHAVGWYENAVEYAERIDDDVEDRDLVVVLDSHLSSCRVLVEKLLLRAAGQEDV